ncbi:hypothetical protein LVD15_12725 [Fulvivirga maritima]|uniref:hypothetical protein n=1 Tax=Fulvivirga maritima TaxID=2904247 RepID=UPI001F471645|nr:hypothetical protein [Fulvivirga maritima]UII29249.1 hypothetical protein LVD15_12725 [Fulvivirga maritima]
MKNRRKLALALSLSVGALLAVASAGRGRSTAPTRSSDLKSSQRKVSDINDEIEAYYI